MKVQPDTALNAEGSPHPLPDGWRMARLGDVCERFRRTIKPNDIEAATYPYLSLEHIESGTGAIVHSPADLLTDSVKSNTFAFRPGQVLYGKLRPYLNKVAIADFEGRCTSEIVPLIPKGLTSEFLAMALRRNETVEHVMRATTGSRMPRADMVHLMQMPIPVPPLPEQERIVRALQERSEAIASAKRAAEAQLDAANAMSAAYLRQVFPAEGEELPAGWEWVRLGDVCFQDRKAVSPSDPLVEETPYLSMGDVESGSGRITTRYGELVRSDIRSTAFAFTQEHVIFGKLNPHLHKFAAPLFSGRCTTEFVPLLPKGVSRDFLCLLIRRPDTVKWSVAGATGSTLPRVRMDHLLRMPVPLPPDVERIRLVASYSDQMELVEQSTCSVNAQLDTASAMSKAYLRAAFEGNLA